MPCLAGIKGGIWGQLSPLGALSFHETKNFTCGEGGALLITGPGVGGACRNHQAEGHQSQPLPEWTRGRIQLGGTWGSSYAPADLLAAFLLAQLEAREQVQAERARIWRFYADHLKDAGGHQRDTAPTVPDGCEPAFHLFYLVAPSATAQRATPGTSGRRRHCRRVSLSAAASVRDGPPLWAAVRAIVQSRRTTASGFCGFRCIAG
jgi:dTDP-4-amino-4,6-dideoxygalactose transaminase